MSAHANIIRLEWPFNMKHVCVCVYTIHFYFYFISDFYFFQLALHHNHTIGRSYENEMQAAAVDASAVPPHFMVTHRHRATTR